MQSAKHAHADRWNDKDTLAHTDTDTHTLPHTLAGVRACSDTDMYAGAQLDVHTPTDEPAQSWSHDLHTHANTGAGVRAHTPINMR